uniref:Receptor-like serine/threonine-protein kinase n=1 Tax=Cucumis sativus TaxID=3659 RepID=A0A0A0KC37_CUCSA
MFLFPQLLILFCCFFVALFMAKFSHGHTTLANDVLAQGQHLSIAFYIPPSSNSIYLGISDNTNDQKPIWIANRNSPFPNNSASISLTIDVNGSLKIQSGNCSFSLFNGGQPTTSSAILQDNGNFVLRELNRDGSVKQIVWQSFDHPTDTLLPGMKIGINHKTNSTWSLISWRNYKSPKPGGLSLGMNPNNTYELVVCVRGELLWRTGNWKEGSFEFLEKDKGFNFVRVSNENETYFIYYAREPNGYSLYRNSYYHGESGELILSQIRLENNGNVRINNEIYDSPCLLTSNEIRGACVWRELDKIPECRNKLSHGYGPYISQINGYELERINGSDYYYKLSGNLTMFECRSICINDCDCIAFGIPAYESDSGCEFWKSGANFIPENDSLQMLWSLDTDSEFLDTDHEFSNTNDESPNGKWKVWVQITVALTLPATFLLLCFIIYTKWRTQIFKAIGKVKKGFLRGMGMISECYNILRIMIIQIRDGKKNPELQFFDFETILSATNNFGEEYSEKKLIFDWEKRLHVVQGIVQGLLYLHYYSRVRIIHRDLKVSNILLDDEMNAKISDFGMARVFKPSDNEANTSRVVGTHQKNYHNYDTERPLNLIGYVIKNDNVCIFQAWELWVNGRGEELIDLGLCNSDDQKAKALRCIHVSLLCVQQIPGNRPTMLDIYFMINNDSAQLPSPKQPAFFIAQSPSSSQREIEEVDSETHTTHRSNLFIEFYDTLNDGCKSSMADILHQGQELTTGSQLIPATVIFVLGFNYYPPNTNTMTLPIDTTSAMLQDDGDFVWRELKPRWISKANSVAEL